MAINSINNSVSTKMSQQEVTAVRHALSSRVDRRQHERGALADEDYYMKLLDSVDHAEFDSDLEELENNPDETVIESEQEHVELNENDPGTSQERGRKRKIVPDSFENDHDGDEHDINNSETSGIQGVPENIENGRNENENNAAANKENRRNNRRRREDHNATWDWVASNFQPKTFHFDRSTAGITSECNITENSSECEYLFEFLDNPLIEMIVEETNRYQGYLVETLGDAVPKHIVKYSPVTFDEIMRFLCIMMLMVHTKKHCIAEYWTTNEVFETKSIRQLMARDRFLQILRLLHFSDNTRPAEREGDKLKKIRPVLDHLRRKFSEKFKPFQDLVLMKALCYGGEGLAFVSTFQTKGIVLV